MIDADPIPIEFFIPAADPLGREEVVGKLRFLPEQLEINWRLKGNVFTGGKGEMQTIGVPYGEIERVELRKRWWRIRSLVLRISDPTLVKEIPGVEMGKMVLEIDDRSREEVGKLEKLIDFKRSVFRLDEHERRLAELLDD